ncbi:MAG: hypothetical protein COB90_09475 [Hyphomicrobiales bacterium]|nr:MAG: hypothetical protein COB90_09475 [Hyphomicrobiales bacterium]
MANSSSVQEPSMEEILASIRRIISDEDTPDEEPAEVEAAAEDDAGVEMAVDDIDALFASDAPASSPEDDDPMADLMAAEEQDDDEDEELSLVEDDIVFAEPEVPEPANIVEPEMDVAFETPVPEPAPVAQSTFATSPVPENPAPVGMNDALLSAGANAAVGSAFGELAHTILTNNSRTLEDLVKEMLRPMLKAWLDDNLPIMVERLVRTEIERVSRGSS